MSPERDEIADGAPADGPDAAPDPVTSVPEKPTLPDDELSGQADLDERLAKPVFDGSTGIDTAQVWIGAFLVLVTALIAYSNSFSLPMHYPDRLALVDVPGAGSVAMAPAAAKAAGVALLPMLTLALNGWFAPGAFAVTHTINVLFHVLNAVLVYFLARRLLELNKKPGLGRSGPELPEPVAMLGGFLMALHPLATESVNLAIGRGALMCATFSLAAVLLVLRAADRESGYPAGALLGAGVCVALAWSCDVLALLVPAFALAADWVANGGAVTKRLPAHAALFGVAITLGLWGMTTSQLDRNPYAALEPEAMNAPRVKSAAYTRGMALAVSPTALTIEHDLPPASGYLDPTAPGANTVVTATTAVGLGLVALILIATRSAGGFGLLWFLAALVPVAFFVPPYTSFNERGLYVAIAGVALMFPWAVSKVVTKKATAVAGGLASVALLLAAAAGTFVRNTVWQDEQALWNDASQKAPDAPAPLIRLGTMHHDIAQQALFESEQLARNNERPAALQRREQAEAEFGSAMNFLEQAVEMKPEDAALRRTLGNVLYVMNRRDDAVAMLTEALRLEPSSQECAATLASLYAADPAGRLPSLDYYRRAARLGPMGPGLTAAYADALARTGNVAGAAQVLVPAVQAAGDAPSPAKTMMQQLALAAERLRETEQKARAAESADSTSPQAMKLRVNALLANGNVLPAFYRLERFLELYPGDADAWLTMGSIRARTGAPEAFLKEYAAAPPVVEGDTPIWMRLVRMCAEQGRWTAARAYLEFAATQSGEYAKPLLRLGELAIEMKQPAVAASVLEDAAKADPADPAPWLLLSDIAIAANNMPQARRYLDEADRLGADPAASAPRREKAGATPETEKQKPRTVLQ